MRTLVTIIALGICAIFAQEKTTMLILDKHGKSVNIDDIAKDIQKCDVLIYGEKHDNIDGHKVELALFQRICAMHAKTALALEMFETDVQALLNRYLSGDINEPEFLKTSRPWQNYETDYKPLVEFARTKKLPVIAANIPRRLASMVAMRGTEAWAQLGEDRVWVPDTCFFLNDDYRKNFEATMNDNPMMGADQMKQISMDNLYKAQVVKDEKMAESILGFLEKNDGFKAVLFVGAFHSDYKLGVAQKLIMREPNLKIVTVSNVVLSAETPMVAESLKVHLALADYIVFTR